MSTNEEICQTIKAAYSSPSHPAAFSSAGALYRYFKGKFSLKTITKCLQEIDSYTLHKEYKKPKQWNPYFVHQRRGLAQIDLIETQPLSRDNDGVRYLMVILSVFSRRIWIYPLKDKTAESVHTALEDWINSLKKQFKTIQTDSGLEFVNRKVRNLLQKHNIKHELSTTSNKCAYVERANRTIQLRLYKMMTHKGTPRYIDFLQDIVTSYNKRPHRGIDYMTPIEADKPKNATRVRGILMEKRRNIKRRKPKYKKGQLVRIKINAKRPSSQSRSYAIQYKMEIFKIHKVHLRMPIPMYSIQSLDTEEIISDPFYANELSPIEIADDQWKVEKVIKSRWVGKGKKRRQQHFVKWQGFGERWNSWIEAEDLVNV